MIRANRFPVWEAEKKLYMRFAYAILLRRIPVLDIPPGIDEIGYTTEAQEIYLAREHRIMTTLSDQEKPVFRMGVMAHELLHQAYTHFGYLNEVCGRYRDPQDSQMVALFANLVEDPAIEYFAPSLFGGEMLGALRFSIRHIYQMSSELSESTDAFGQLISALVQFGDMGLLKGSFTFPEAREYFKKIAPEFYRTVEEPDARKRIDAAERWMILTRPLWHKAAEEKGFTEMYNQALDAMNSAGMDGDGDPQSETPKKPKDKSEAGERRKAFAKALEGKGEDEGDQETSGNPSGESDTNPSTDGSEDGEGENAGTGSDHGDRCDSGDEMSGNAGTSEETEEGEAQSGKQAGHNRNGEKSGNPSDPFEQFRDQGQADTEIPVPPELIEEIWDLVADTLKGMRKEEDDGNIDLPVMLPVAKGGKPTEVTCLNVQVAPGEPDAYARVLGECSHDIRLLIHSLKMIFQNDLDERLRTTSGRYRIKRDLTHTSVKIFDKRKESRNASDLAVMLLIDISGSMNGEKIAVARRTAVTLAETFAALDIPCYIFGFTADTDGYSVIHRHFVSWKNTKQDRLSLCNLKAVANNDDGYSIRYAAQLLSRRREEHKILFVISDGAPNCHRYTRENGIADTSAAIRDAQKKADVFGIGIGGQVSGELPDMYRGSYLTVRCLSDLSAALARQLKRIVKNY